jgi:hypothetical protein
MSFGQNDRSKIKKSPLSIKLRGEKTAKKETNKWYIKNLLLLPGGNFGIF